MIENLDTATPVEIDTRIVAILVRRSEIENNLRREQYTLDSTFATEAQLNKAVETVKGLNAQMALLIDERAELDDEFRGRGGWTRYFLVLNSNGHVHTSTECETCFADTEFGWLTQFSGTDHDEMGKLSGMDACARCFPNLPAEIMQAKRDARVDVPERIAEREARQAAAALKAAKAAEKGITNADGSTLYQVDDDNKGGWRETTYVVKTAIAAKRNAMEAAYDLFFYNEKHPTHPGVTHPQTAAWIETVRRNVEALSAKEGKPVEEIRAEIDKKVEAKYRREFKNSF